MSVRKGAKQDLSEALEATGDLLEQKLVAFAEQLGSLVGTVQTRAEGWLDRKTLSTEVGRIRDTAAALLNQMNRKATAARQAAAKRTATAGARPSRGPVDAPGKRHRKPAPQERLDKRMGEPEGKKMGQKGVKKGRRGVRG